MKILKPKPPPRKRRGTLFGAWMLAICLTDVAASAEPQHDLLFFLSVESFDNLSDPVDSIDNSFVRPTADILYAYNSGRFRFLGEYIWSSTEDEMERFKAGWQTSDQTMIWFGRYHTTAKFWTTEYHHGQFMQSSISRPGVEEWEDESGPMPSHLTGLSIEHEVVRADESAFNFGFAAGLGPVFEGQELVPFDVLDPGSGHELSYNLRSVWRPDAFADNQIGLMIGWNDIPVISDSHPNLTDLTDIKQLTIGVFGDWNLENWRVLTSWVYFDNEVNSTSTSERDEFVAGYLQAEYRASDNWTVFGRLEAGFSEDSSIYLRLLPAFIAHRHMLGVRWDFLDNQSLTGEIADTSTQGEGMSHDNFKELRLQWSAVFP